MERRAQEVYLDILVSEETLENAEKLVQLVQMDQRESQDRWD